MGNIPLLIYGYNMEKHFTTQIAPALYLSEFDKFTLR